MQPGDIYKEPDTSGLFWAKSWAAGDYDRIVLRDDTPHGTRWCVFNPKTGQSYWQKSAPSLVYGPELEAPTA